MLKTNNDGCLVFSTGGTLYTDYTPFTLDPDLNVCDRDGDQVYVDYIDEQGKERSREFTAIEKSELAQHMIEEWNKLLIIPEQY